jgi:hypothetical protein
MFSPGLIASVCLLLPLSILAYYVVYLKGVLTPVLFAVSLIGGIALMAIPVIYLLLS